MSALGYGVAFAAGVLVGWQLMRASETACCKRISSAVRDKVSDKLGGTVAAVGDLFNVWGPAPALLDAFGVET